MTLNKTMIPKIRIATQLKTDFQTNTQIRETSIYQYTRILINDHDWLTFGKPFQSDKNPREMINENFPLGHTI